MHPIDHYDTLRRGREELLRRAEYERLARKALFRKRMNWLMHRKAASWLGMHMVSWGKKLKQFGTIAEREPAPTSTKRVPVYQLSKTSPHH